MKRIYESMTRVKVGESVVRVWRSEVSLSTIDNRDIKALKPELARCVTKAGIIDRIQELPRVSAIEVLDGDGNGVLVYNDWP